MASDSAFDAKLIHYEENVSSLSEYYKNQILEECGDTPGNVCHVPTFTVSLQPHARLPTLFCVWVEVLLSALPVEFLLRSLITCKYANALLYQCYTTVGLNG